MLHARFTDGQAEAEVKEHVCRPLASRWPELRLLAPSTTRREHYTTCQPPAILSPLPTRPGHFQLAGSTKPRTVEPGGPR